MSELIAKNRKINVYMAERNKKLYVNAVRMTFGEEPAGTKVYVKENKNGFTISKTPLDGAFEREVKPIKSMTGLHKPQQYISFKDIVSESKAYDIYADVDGTYTLITAKLQPSKKKNVIRKQIKKVNSGNNIQLPACWIEQQLKTSIKEDYCMVIEEHYRPYTYMRITIRNIAECENIPTLNDVCGNRLQRYLDHESVIYKRKIQACLNTSRFFRAAANISYQSDILIEEKEKELIITAMEHHCDVCGKYIKGDINRSYNLDICNSCNNAVKILKKHTADGMINLSEVKRELQKAEKMLTEIYGEITEEK